MPHEAIVRYRKLLEAKAADLSRSLRDRRKIAVEPSPEEFEVMTLMAQRDFEVAAMDRESRLLKEVRSALERIEDGSFGSCESCGESIAPRRLDAVPWTRRCVTCQEIVDGGPHRRPGGFGGFGIAA